MIYITQPDLPEINEYVKCLKKIWSTRILTNNGEFAQALELKLASYLGAKNLLLVSNGTLALQLALRALMIKGEVITTPFTFAATTNSILWERLTPVFADIDPETYNINPKDVEKKITTRTSAIMAVHVYGNPCYVEQLKEIAQKHNLKVIYDAAHAFDVEYSHESILSWGDSSILSFHATKIFNTIEGGAIVINDNKLVEEIQLLRNHGIRSEEEVPVVGTNAKMNEFQAAMGLCNLEKVGTKREARERIYTHYKEGLDGTNGIKFQRIIASKYNYSYMPVCFGSKKIRDRVYTDLIKIGVKSRKYFFPLTVNFGYFNKFGEDLVKKFNLKNAKSISDSILCLPIYSDLQMKVVDKIIDCTKQTVSLEE